MIYNICNGKSESEIRLLPKTCTCRCGRRQSYIYWNIRQYVNMLACVCVLCIYQDPQVHMYGIGVNEVRMHTRGCFRWPTKRLCLLYAMWICRLYFRITARIMEMEIMHKTQDGSNESQSLERETITFMYTVPEEPNDQTQHLR